MADTATGAGRALAWRDWHGSASRTLLLKMYEGAEVERFPAQLKRVNRAALVPSRHRAG